MRARNIVVILAGMLVTGAPGRTPGAPERQWFWASTQFGYGVLDKSSDQETHNQQGTFAMALDLGLTLNHHVRVGVQLNGWLLESYNVWDPAKGESVSQAFVITQVYPWSDCNAFVKAGVGRATYSNSGPLEFGSSGWGQTIGVGYDWPLGRGVSLTSTINYSQGGLGDVHNVLVTIYDRRYRVFDVGVGLTYR